VLFTSKILTDTPTLYTIIDECQVAAVVHPRWFCSYDKETPHPLLRQILSDVQAALPQGATILSGTGLSKDMVEKAACSFVSKDTQKANLHDTGAFDEEDRLKQYVTKYLSTSVEQALLDRLWTWLRGQFVFTYGCWDFWLTLRSITATVFWLHS
jgi:hypothetical protein